MALTNYERQKRWREKNRATYNRRRRDNRKKEVSVEDEKPISKVDELRQLMTVASTEPDEPKIKLVIYRDDYGRQISETQWKRLQGLKEQARNGGYQIDEFTQI